MTASIHQFPRRAPSTARSITVIGGIALVAFLFGLFIGRSPQLLASDQAGPRIIVQNTYFPKIGMEAEVLATRLEASAVRARAGLVVGRVLKHVEGPDDAPYIMWEAEYESADAREADVAALADTDFSRVSSHMGTLLDRFGRTVWEVVED